MLEYLEHEMVRRIESQWRDLLESQQNSRRNVVQHFRQHQLNAKYFRLEKRQLTEKTSMAWSHSLTLNIYSPSYSM